MTRQSSAIRLLTAGLLTAVAGLASGAVARAAAVDAVSPSAHATTTRVSVGTDGSQAPDGAESSSPRAVSANGRLVAFRTFSRLASNDTNEDGDIYVRDSLTNETTLVSLTADGMHAGGGSHQATISADGRYVTFYSFASALAPNDLNGVGDIFVRDLVAHTTTRVSVASDGTEANSVSGGDDSAQLSDDGRYVAFGSWATNLVPDDTNGRQDVFVHDRTTGVTTRASIGSGGVEAVGGDSLAPAMSADGRFVAFSSGSVNLSAGDTNNVADIFVRDRLNGTTALASIGVQSDGGSVRPSISASGRYVAFETWQSDLAAIFVRDLHNGTTARASVAKNGAQANGHSWHASISGDGRLVAFQSVATNLDNLGSGDVNGNFDVFVKDRQTGKVTRENVTPQGDLSNAFGVHPSLSADGKYILFDGGDDLAPGDTNNLPDVYLRQRS